MVTNSGSGAITSGGHQWRGTTGAGFDTCFAETGGAGRRATGGAIGITGMYGVATR